MSIPDRLYNIAKGHLDRASQRWSEIDARAQQELDSFLAAHAGSNNTSAWDRAVGKINSAAASKELSDPAETVDNPATADADFAALEAKVAAQTNVPASSSSAPPAPPPSQTLLAAYKVLGVEPGCDFPGVQKAYQELRRRAAPERFPGGSPEQDAARTIQRRVESAFTMLANNLVSTSNRFDRLEL